MDVDTTPSFASIATSAGSLVPPFSPSRRAYAVAVPASVASISVTATPAASGCSVAVAGRRAAPGAPSEPVDLAVGRTLVSVEVVSADGRSRASTTLKVIRAHPAPDWEMLLEAAPWAPRDSAGEIVHGGRMWIIGGYTPALTSDVWSSDDGIGWQRAGAVPTEAGINVPAAFSLAGRMWVSANDGALFSSPDGRAWTLELERPPWGGRYCAGCTVHDGRAWVLGGMRAGRAYNDVWASSNGRDWVEVTPSAQWSPRQLFGNVVSHAGRLWVVGGGITGYEPFRSYRDVWCSRDGRRWTRVTDEAPWPGRIWSSCVSYRGRIWLVGGFRSQPAWNNWNDVWYSADGARWRALETEHLWQPRHEISTCVLAGALWVVGGNAWPLRNDVWRLRIEGLTFVSQPVVEELAGLEYRYRALAEFGNPPGGVRYRLADSPSWLRVEPGNGIVRGRPPAAGDYPVALEARSRSGETATQRYTLHVLP
jgi:hypothetical protein